MGPIGYNATSIYSGLLHEVSRYGAHWSLHYGRSPYGKTHKGCQSEPKFASVLGLVPLIINQVYTTKGLRMCAQEATQSLQEPKAWVGALGSGFRVQAALGLGVRGFGPSPEHNFYIYRVATRSFAVRGPLVDPLWPFSLWQDAQRLSIGAKFCKRARLGATYYQPSLYH